MEKSRERSPSPGILSELKFIGRHTWFPSRDSSDPSSERGPGEGDGLDSLMIFRRDDLPRPTDERLDAVDDAESERGEAGLPMGDD